MTALLASYLQSYAVAPVFDEAEVAHWLSFQVRCDAPRCGRCRRPPPAGGRGGAAVGGSSRSRLPGEHAAEALLPPSNHGTLPSPRPEQEDVVHSYVVEAPDGRLTDLLSFYTLPSSVIGNEQYDSLKVRGRARLLVAAESCCCSWHRLPACLPA